VDIAIREMTGLDITREFLETLSSLAEVNLTVGQAAKVFQRRLRNNIRTYLALDENQVVGTASLLVEQKFIHAGGRVGHIEDVAVRRDYQRKGVGKLLVQRTIVEAEKAGCYKVLLACFPDRVPFYERLGFRLYEEGMRLDLPRATKNSVRLGSALGVRS